MNLPQEYWEKQTLFEIASGLGTPLSMDEATQHRRFGIFARVLIDVDLSENLFESVVVEREEHDLSVAIQYEKYPMFCAHCKMIGHTTQNCSKLSAPNTVKAPAQKFHNAPAKPGVNGKKPMPVGNLIGKSASHTTCCESDSKLEKLKFTEAVKIGARFEKSEYDFWTRIGISHS